MTLDPRDFALQATVPTHIVPMFGTFEPLAAPGHRLLVASNGLWVEARRPGIYSRQLIAPQKDVAIPYGAMNADLQLQFQNLGTALATFIDHARSAMPNEVAMGLIWDDQAKTMEEVILEPMEHGPNHIIYKRPDLEPHQHVVVDFHSHGNVPAFFSPTDNKDDRGDLKIAVVVGNLDTDQPTVKARLCTMGCYRPLPISLPGNQDRNFYGEAHVSSHLTG